MQAKVPVEWIVVEKLPSGEAKRSYFNNETEAEAELIRAIQRGNRAMWWVREELRSVFS